jgi:hypothetical protein
MNNDGVSTAVIDNYSIQNQQQVSLKLNTKQTKMSSFHLINYLSF